MNNNDESWLWVYVAAVFIGAFLAVGAPPTQYEVCQQELSQSKSDLIWCAGRLPAEPYCSSDWCQSSANPFLVSAAHKIAALVAEDCRIGGAHEMLLSVCEFYPEYGIEKQPALCQNESLMQTFRENKAKCDEWHEIRTQDYKTNLFCDGLTIPPEAPINPCVPNEETQPQAKNYECGIAKENGSLERGCEKVYDYEDYKAGNSVFQWCCPKVEAN